MGGARLHVSVHARMGVRGRSLDGDGVDMQLEYLPAGVVAPAVMLRAVLVLVSGHIDPGEF